MSCNTDLHYKCCHMGCLCQQLEVRVSGCNGGSNLDGSKGGRQATGNSKQVRVDRRSGWMDGTFTQEIAVPVTSLCYGKVKLQKVLKEM